VVAEVVAQFLMELVLTVVQVVVVRSQLPLLLEMLEALETLHLLLHLKEIMEVLE
jgi:hypothetical protein